MKIFTDKNAYADTCNMGYGAYEYIRVYELLKKIGIEKARDIAQAAYDRSIGK